MTNQIIILIFFWGGGVFNQAEKFSSSPHILRTFKEETILSNKYTKFQKMNLFYIRKIFDIIHKIRYYTSKMKC